MVDQVLETRLTGILKRIVEILARVEVLEQHVSELRKPSTSATTPTRPTPPAVEKKHS